MLHLWSIRWLLLHLLIGQLHLQYARATWPLSNTSAIQLLGLFQDDTNASESETTALSVHSRAMFKAAIILSQQLNITIEGKPIGWQVVPTGGTAIGALSGTCRIMSTSNIIGIVGPSFSREAPNIADLAQTIGIPTISYAATAPQLSNKKAYPAFHRTVPSDNAAALAIVNLFQKYNWTSCIIIYQNDEFGNGGADAISVAFDQNGLTVARSLLFDISTLKFRGDLKSTLLTSSTRIVILWTGVLYTSLILQYALDNDVLGPQFLWILCSSVSLNSFNQATNSKLIGIIIIEPAVGSEVGAPINTTLLDFAYAIWEQYEPETFPRPTQVDNYAFFAFDATWTLIQSLQKLCSIGFNSSSSCLSAVKSSFCFDQRFLNMGTYFNAISTTKFLGVSGLIQFSNTTTDRIDGSYYIAQSIQPSSNGVNYVPVLQWSGSGSWKSATQANVIIWPGSSLTPPSGIPGLSGVILRIAVIVPSSFTTQIDVIDESGQTTTKLIGYAQDLIDLLQFRMGFTPQFMRVLSNQTYDQIIQGVTNNVFDIIVSDITITAKRRSIVDFSNSIFDTSLRIIVRQSTSVKVDLFSYLRPFSPGLWLLILAAVLYASILMTLIERRKNEALKDKSIVSSVAMSIWYSFGTMVGYGVDFQVRTAAGRLLTMGLYMLSIILVASYTANLASDLTVSKSKNIISGIDDIKNGKIPFNRIGIIVGSSIEDFYLREVSGGSRNYYPLKSPSDVYSSLLDNVIDAAISDTGQLEHATNEIYCNLTLVGSDFDPSSYGIVMRKDWLYTQTLDVNILALRESGDADILKSKWFEGNTCAGLSESDVGTSYKIESLAGLFLTFAIISILSLLLFAWLTRPIMKDYLCKLAQRKGWLAQQNLSVGKVANDDVNGPL